MLGGQALGSLRLSTELRFVVVVVVVVVAWSANDCCERCGRFLALARSRMPTLS